MDFRNSIIFTGLTVLLLISTISFKSINSAEDFLGKKCSEFDYRGIQQCVAGIDSSLLHVSAVQRANQWCWAASIESVFKYYGYNISQEDIVYQTWGRIQNMPGRPYDILSALNKTYRDEDGYVFSVRASTINANPATASQDLSNDNPLIIGTLGHAMVLTAVTYERDRYGNGNVTSAIVRDPWPGRSKRTLTAQEWYNTSFLARIRVYAE